MIHRPVWVIAVLLLVACKRGPEGSAGPQGPGGPNYVPPNQQGYIRGTIIAQDTFNNQRARESYNYVYYSQAPCFTYSLGPDTIQLSISRHNEPHYLSLGARISFEVDTSTSPPTVLSASADISYAKQIGNNLLVYSQNFDIADSQDTLLIDTLTFSPQLTQVRGRLRGVRRSVTPPDTVTFEFESVIPRRYE